METALWNISNGPHHRGFGMPKDVIPWRQSDFEDRAAYVKASLPATVVREGRLLYESAGETSQTRFPDP
jgi:hypothetical protein